jgi:tetratricopeptide (TPR) repeat protein
MQQAAEAPQEQPKPKKSNERSWEDQLILGRMRRHMKWVFVLLAIVFALGFVVFGVGTGGGGGSVGDVLRDLFGKNKSDIPTLAEAQQKVRDNPNDPSALRDLAVAQRNALQYQAAATTLEKYLKLRPKDASTVTLLGATYGTAAANAQSLASQLSTQGLSTGFSANACQFGQGSSGFLNAVCQNAADEALTEGEQAKANAASQQATELYAKQAATYATLVKLTPDNADAYKLWAAAAGRGNKTQDEITAYEELLRRFPDDPEATRIKGLLTQLKASNDVQVG